MGHNWLLIGLVESMLAASLGFPVAAVLGRDPRLGFLLAFVAVILPPMLLGRFTSDFTPDGKISPNLASRLLNGFEYVRAMAAGIGFLAMVSMPVGILLGFRVRSLAVFAIVSGVLLSGILSAVLAIVMRPKRRDAKSTEDRPDA